MNTSKPVHRSLDGVAMASYSSGSQTPHGFRPPPRPLSTSTSSTPASALRKDRFITHRSSDVSSLSHFLLTTEESITPLQLSHPPPRTALTTPTLVPSPLLRGGSLGAGGGGGGSDGVLAQLVESHSTHAGYGSGASPSPSPARSLFGASHTGAAGGGERPSSRMGGSTGGAAAARPRPTTTFFSSSLPGGRGGSMSGRQTGAGMESSGRSLSGTLLSLLDASNRFDSEVGTDAGLDENGEEIHSAVRPGKSSLSLRRSDAGGGRGTDRLSSFMGGGRATRGGGSASRPSAAAYDPRESAGGASISSGMLLAGGSFSAAGVGSTTTAPASLASSQHLLPSPRPSDAMFLDLEAEQERESAYPTPTPVAHLSVEPYNVRLARSLFSDAPQTSVLCHAPTPTEWGKGGSSRPAGGGTQRHTQGSRTSMCSSVSSCASLVPLPTGGGRSTSRTASRAPPPSFAGGGGVPRGVRLPSEGTVTPPFSPHDPRAGGGRAPPSPPPLPPPPAAAPPEGCRGRPAWPTLDTADEGVPLSSRVATDHPPLPHHHHGEDESHSPLVQPPVGDFTFTTALEDHDGAGDANGWIPSRHPPLPSSSVSRGRDGSASRSRFGNRSRSLSISRGDVYRVSRGGRRKKLPLRSTSGEGFTNRFAFGHERAGEVDDNEKEEEEEEEVGMEEEEGRGRACVVLRGTPLSPHSLPLWSGRGEGGSHCGPEEENRSRHSAVCSPPLFSLSARRRQAENESPERWHRSCTSQRSVSFGDREWKTTSPSAPPDGRCEGEGEEEAEQRREMDLLLRHPILSSSRAWRQSKESRSGRKEWSRRRTNEEEEEDEEEEEEEKGRHQHHHEEEEEEVEANARRTDLSLLSQTGSRRQAFPSLLLSRDGSGCRSSGSSSSDDEEAFPSSGAVAPLPPHLRTPPSSLRLRQRRPLAPLTHSGDRAAAHGDPQSEMQYFNQRPAVVFGKNKAQDFVSRSFRYIPKTSVWVLDAIRMVDEFYYNVLDCSRLGELTIALNKEVYLWDFSTQETEVLTKQPDCISALRWAPEGERLASSDVVGDVIVWDAKHSKESAIFTTHHQRVCGLAWNVTGNILASGSADRSIILHDIRTSTSALSITNGPTGEICSLQWSLNDLYLASGADDGKLLVWDSRRLETPLHTFTQHTAAVKAISWHPSQPHLLVSGGGTNDGMLRFWSVDTGECIKKISTDSSVSGVLWHPNGVELASSHGYPGNQVTLWRYPSLSRTIDLYGHTGRILNMCLSAGGETVITVGSDPAIRFWACFPPANAEGGGAPPA